MSPEAEERLKKQLAAVIKSPPPPNALCNWDKLKGVQSAK